MIFSADIRSASVQIFFLGRKKIPCAGLAYLLLEVTIQSINGEGEWHDIQSSSLDQRQRPRVTSITARQARGYVELCCLQARMTFWSHVSESC